MPRTPASQIELRGPFLGLNLRPNRYGHDPREALTALNMVLSGADAARRPGSSMFYSGSWWTVQPDWTWVLRPAPFQSMGYGLVGVHRHPTGGLGTQSVVLYKTDGSATLVAASLTTATSAPNSVVAVSSAAMLVLIATSLAHCMRVSRVPAAHTGTLTTRTNDTAGVITATNHTIVAGMKIDILWNGGQRQNCSVTAAIGAPTWTITFSGGTGDALPAQGFAVTISAVTSVTSLDTLTAHAYGPRDYAGGSGGPESGWTANYIVVQYDDRTDSEMPLGNLASAQRTIAGNGQWISVGWGDSGQPAMTAPRVRIYRRQMGVDTTWYKLAEVAINYDPGVLQGQTCQGRYTDTANWASIAKDAQFALQTSRFMPGPPVCACLHRGRLFWAPYSEPGVVYFSDQNKPLQFNLVNSRRFDVAEGENLTAMVSHGTTLYLFSPTRTFVLTGESGDTYVASLLADGIGCCGPFAALAVEDWVYFADYNGLYRVRGESLEAIGERIAPAWMAETLVDRQYTTIAWDPELRAVIFNVGRARHQYVWHYAEGGWTDWNLRASAVCTAPASGQALRRSYVYYGTDWLLQPSFDSRVARLSRPSDADPLDIGGQLVNWDWTTPPLELGVRRLKRWHALHARVSDTLASDTLWLNCHISPNGPGQPVGQFTGYPNYEVSVPVGMISSSLGVSVAGSGGGYARLSLIALDAEAVEY